MSDHKVEQIKGRVKEAVGDVTGDKGLEYEGKLDQAVASAKKHIDKATDKIGNAVHHKDAADSKNATGDAVDPKV